MCDTTVDRMPPDRGGIATEQRHPGSLNMDELGVAAQIGLMIDDSAAVIGALRSAAPALGAFIQALVPRIRAGGRLIYLGAGTSGRLGVLDASECPPTFQSDPQQIIGIIAGGDEALRRSSEGLEDDPGGAMAALDDLSLTSNDCVLGIAAGGTTPYVVGGVTHASGCGVLTGLLTCARMREPPGGCDHLIVLDTGPEVLTGSTRLKAGTATKIALNIITTTLFTQLGKVYGNLMVDLRATNNKLRDRALRILMELCPELDRHAALAQLDEAGGELKTAIAMSLLKSDATAARQHLLAADGSLRRVILQCADGASPGMTISSTT